jgi:hypothetical protein
MEICHVSLVISVTIFIFLNPNSKRDGMRVNLLRLKLISPPPTQSSSANPDHSKSFVMVDI